MIAAGQYLLEALLMHSTACLVGSEGRIGTPSPPDSSALGSSLASCLVLAVTRHRGPGFVLAVGP